MPNYKVYLIKKRSDDSVVYVGITKNELWIRFEGHIHRKKISKKDYYMELVIDGLSRLDAADLERKLIQQYDLINCGWNNSPGSVNGFSNDHSEKTKQLLSKINKGKKVSAEHAAKNRVARLGKKNSSSHQEALIKSRQKSVMCVETGKIYISARHAAKDLNLQYSKISLVCNGKRSTTGGLHFKFVDEITESSRNDLVVPEKE